MIKNVKCFHCGAQGYNPSVPKGHVIDTCSCDSCVSKDQPVIGFKDGQTFNCTAENLYRVAAEVYTKPMIDSTLLSNKEIELNDLIATAYYHYFSRDFDSLEKTLKIKEISDLPEAYYLQSKIYFKKVNNSAKGVKYLKMAAEAGLPSAMAEYGYIIAIGLYGTLSRPQDGLDYLYDAAQAKEPLSGSYLADIYHKGIYKGTDFDLLTYQDWYQLLEIGMVTGDPMVYVVLGTFHYNGFGCQPDEDIAIEYFRYAAKNEYVLGMQLLIRVLIDRYFDTMDENIREEILVYGKFYLEHALNKTNSESMEVKKIYDKLL
jgi:TPR repeat protein